MAVLQSVDCLHATGQVDPCGRQSPLTDELKMWFVSRAPIVVQHVSLFSVSQSVDCVHDLGQVAVPVSVQMGLA
jgi:hypothetical protein